MAESVGFEPTVHISAYDGLANRCLRPLSQLSNLVAGAGLEPATLAYETSRMPFPHPAIVNSNIRAAYVPHQVDHNFLNLLHAGLYVPRHGQHVAVDDSSLSESTS